MRDYTIIDKESGEDISEGVKVIKNVQHDYKYCRMKADEWLDKADAFHEEFVIGKIGLVDNSYDKYKKQYQEMMDIAGDWEDKEFAARFMPIVDCVAQWSDNPLLRKEAILSNMVDYTDSMGLPNLGKHLL